MMKTCLVEENGRWNRPVIRNNPTIETVTNNNIAVVWSYVHLLFDANTSWYASAPWESIEPISNSNGTIILLKSVVLDHALSRRRNDKSPIPSTTSFVKNIIVQRNRRAVVVNPCAKKTHKPRLPMWEALFKKSVMILNSRCSRSTNTAHIHKVHQYRYEC